MNMMGAGVSDTGGMTSAYAQSKKTAGQDTGNVFATSVEDMNDIQKSLKNATNYQGSQDALNGVQGSNTATSQIQNNGILGGTFGKGGTLDRTSAEEQNLANKGYSLKPEDQEAYGQASGNIARMFGHADQGLAQSLSDRGLSGSGVAAQQFAGQFGSKQEQLAGLQTDIAQRRMQMNMERLGQTRNFLANLTQQGANDINQQYGRQLSGEQQNFQETMGKANLGMQRLGAQQEQGNEQLSQRMQTQAMPTWASVLNAHGQNDQKTGAAMQGQGQGGGGGGGGMGGMMSMFGG